jgi:hypothetical protein
MVCHQPAKITTRKISQTTFSEPKNVLAKLERDTKLPTNIPKKPGKKTTGKQFRKRVRSLVSHKTTTNPTGKIKTPKA